jgi:hypothetical protein
MPQMIQLPTRALNILAPTVKVAKLVTLLVTLGANNGIAMLDPVAIGASFGKLRMVRYSMYVPGKYLPLLLGH